MKQIIAIDLGTTHTKAILIGENGNVLHSLKSPVTTIQELPGQHEQDPKAICEAVIKLIKELVLLTHPSQIACISFSAAMHSIIAVDAMGEPLTGAITWADSRSSAIADQLQNTSDGQDIYNHTGTPIHAMSPLCKIAWLQATEPIICKKTAKYISIKEYIFYTLFGEYVVDFSLASATGLFDYNTLQWYAPALEFAQINVHHLSTPMPVTYSLHTLLPKYQILLGLPDGTPFILGGNDGSLANLGSGVLTSGIAALTIGTSGAVRMTVLHPIPDADGALFNYIIDNNLYITGGPINNGGIALQWVAANILKQSIQNAHDLQMLWQTAASAPVGSRGILFLPYLLGERAPIWNANASAAFIGIRENHSSAHLARAVLEGISF